MNIESIWRYDLRRGSTDHPANGACLFDAGMWLVYGRIGDNPPCSCPVIREYAIALNDRMPDAERQRLKPFILRVVGNRDREAEPARRRYIHLETARRVVPMGFDRLRPDLAAQMRALPDNATERQIRDLMQTARAATAAATADAAAAYAAAAAATVWTEAIAILDGVLRIGKRSPEFDEADVRAAVERFEVAREEEKV